MSLSTSLSTLTRAASSSSSSTTSSSLLACRRIPAIRSQFSRASSSVTAPATQGERRKMRMIILGAPGSGKGTQGERLVNKWDISTVGVGDLLRREISRGSELGKQAEGVMKAGGLLPDDIVLKLVEPELDALRDKDWILDGFPRKASQAVLLDQVLAKHGEELNVVVNLAVPDEVILQRIEERFIHSPSGRVYNLSFNPPKVAGHDDVTGEPLSRRPDDTAEIFGKRLASFHAENDTLLAHYSKIKVNLGPPVGEVLKLVTLKGRTSDEIFPLLDGVLEERFPGLQEKKA